LDKIVSLSQSGKGDNLLVLSVHLAAGAHLDSVFQASAKPEIDRLLDQFESLAPAAAVWGD